MTEPNFQSRLASYPFVRCSLAVALVAIALGFSFLTKNDLRNVELFYTTKSGGMGMGLSISRSILHSHRGRLWVSVNEGPGTSSHFILPKYQEQDAGAAAI